MKLLRFGDRAKPRIGVLDGGEVVDLVAALEVAGGRADRDRALLSDIVALIAAGDRGLDLVAEVLQASRSRGAARISLASAELRAPLSPTVILCSGENYWDHRDEKPKVEGKEPEFFLKAATGVIGPGDDILLDPRVTKKLDYETELLVVMGAPARHIPESRALDHVFGYSIMNDVTARDRQVRLRPDGSSVYSLGPGKNFDSCAPIGPYIATRDEVPDPQALPLRTYVNGELRQNNTTAKMIWSVAALVAFFSTFLTLQPGIVISTGTPGGTAWGTDPELGGRQAKRGDIKPAAGYLRPGDEVACEIGGLGRLENKVVLSA